MITHGRDRSAYHAAGPKSQHKEGLSVRYLVTYDVSPEWSDYAPLYAAIEHYTVLEQPLESVWIVESSLPAAAIVQALNPHVGSGGRLAVAPIAEIIYNENAKARITAAQLNRCLQAQQRPT